jgi:hypothetical protein
MPIIRMECKMMVNKRDWRARGAAGIAAGALLSAFGAGCSVPTGVDLEAKDWGLHIPVGIARFETSGDGFSMGKLRASEIQSTFGPAFEGAVYDGVDGENSSNRIFVSFDPDGGGTTKQTVTIDANNQQTYLVRYPISLGLEDVRKEMKDNFNAAIEEIIETLIENGNIPGEDDGFIPQPADPTDLQVPLYVNDTASSESGVPKVTAVDELVYHVTLEFKPGKLPRVDGTGEVINEVNKMTSFAGWVQFQAGGTGGYQDAAGIILDLPNNKVIWVSDKIDVESVGDTDADLLDVQFDLKPATTVSMPGGFTPGIYYKVDIELHDFETIELKTIQDKSAEAGDTGALADIIEMLGGAEFDVAQLFIYSGIAIDGFVLTAKSSGVDEELYNNDLGAANTFNHANFFKIGGPPVDLDAAGAANPSASVDLTAKLLAKNAPKYQIWYTIPEDTEITLGRNTSTDAVILLPLKFSVTGSGNPDPGDAGLVYVEEQDNAPVSYIKLNVSSLDEMLGQDGDDFDLRSHTKQFGKLKKAVANLTIANPTLPEAFFIGLGEGGEYGSRPLYKSAVSLKDKAKEDLHLDTSGEKISVPKPALLIPDTGGGKANFKIEPVPPFDPAQGSEEAGDLAVKIVADILMDLKYSL